MMYTQCQRYVATTLLFSLLLQSCGSPNWKVADDTSPMGNGTKTTYHPTKVKQHRESLELVTAANFADDVIEPEVEGAHVLGDAASSADATEALAEVSGTSPSSSGKGSVLPMLPQQLYASSPSPRPATKQAKSISVTSSDNKPRHIVSDQDAIARRKGTPLAGARAVPVVAARPTQSPALQPTGSLHADRLHQACLCQPKLQHTLKAAEHKEAHLRPAISLTLQPYPSAQGHQVCFQEAEGKWLAQVQDRWGRVQILPVVFAPGQGPTQALHKLASTSTGQYKY